MEDAYIIRAKLIQDALEAGSPNGQRVLGLSTLIELLRERAKQDPSLSSLYFAGAEVDHPYFLQTEQVAIGFAILPEDRGRAAQWKRHPHQTEVILVLEGTILLEESNGNRDEIASTRLDVGDVRLLSPGTCHRVTLWSSSATKATYLFLKSNPVAEPRAEAC
jgi:quercetin dioxygenase-like cupin family protein